MGGGFKGLAIKKEKTFFLLPLKNKNYFTLATNRNMGISIAILVQKLSKSVSGYFTNEKKNKNPTAIKPGGGEV